MFQRISKKVRTIAATLVVSAIIGVAAATGLVGHNTASASYTCDRINIIYCGVSSIANFQQIYASNKSGHVASPTVKHDYTDLHTVYSAQGVSATMINAMNTGNTFSGMVNPDGTVTINGKVVGTNGKVSARYSVPGAVSVPGTNVYIRLVTSDFKHSHPVYVRMDGDKMLFAVMKECGNGVTATPVLPKPAPKPQPQPQPQPKPTPAYACTLLDVKQGENRSVTITKFEQTATNGATFTNVTLDWGDQTTPLVTNNAVGQTHTFGADGTYVIRATANFSVNGQNVSSTSESCAKSVTYSTTPQVLSSTTTTPTTLVNTGPGDIAGLFAGSSILGAFGHRFFTKRRLNRA